MRKKVFKGCPLGYLTKSYNWRQCRLEPVTLRVPSSKNSFLGGVTYECRDGGPQ